MAVVTSNSGDRKTFRCDIATVIIPTSTLPLIRLFHCSLFNYYYCDEYTNAQLLILLRELWSQPRHIQVQLMDQSPISQRTIFALLPFSVRTFISTRHIFARNISFIFHVLDKKHQRSGKHRFLLFVISEK